MVIYFKRLTDLLKINGIAIFPFIFIKRDYHDEKKLINHERIHIRQQIEMLVIPFYLTYFYYNITRGYWNNPFELEAYKHDEDLSYLKDRKKYSWIKHI
jgi:hypothetical protein